MILRLQALPPDRRHPALLSPAETDPWAEITLAGGAYHEVRRIFAALGSHVLGLCRVGFGRLVLPVGFVAPRGIRPHRPGRRLVRVSFGTLKGSRAPRDELRAAKPRYALRV